MLRDDVYTVDALALTPSTVGQYCEEMLDADRLRDEIPLVVHRHHDGEDAVGSCYHAGTLPHLGCAGSPTPTGSGLHVYAVFWRC